MDPRILGDIRYSICSKRQIIFATRFDALTKERIYAEWEALPELDGFDPALDTVVDYSAVPEIRVDFQDIKELCQEMPKRDLRTGNVAIVTGFDYGRQALAKLFCAIANQFESRKNQVFGDAQRAEDWLLSLRDPMPTFLDSDGTV